MKKALIIVLAALVLICAVSCNDAKRNLGTVKLNTKNYKVCLNEESAAAIDSAKLALNENDDATIDISMKDINKGTVKVNLPAGKYSVTMYFYDAEGAECGEIRFYEALEVAHSVRLDSHDAFITVDAGQVTYCEPAALDN